MTKDPARKPPAKQRTKPKTPDPDEVPTAGGVPVFCAHDTLMDPGMLSPNPRNPNKHPDDQIALLAKVIAAQGWRAPITVSTLSKHVVRGHGRLMAAQKLGVDKVPVDFQDYPDPESEMADLVADNRIAELADPDRAALKDILLELDTGEVDMDLTGFDESALEEILTAAPPEPTGGSGEDPGPSEPPPEPQTKPGDLWILGEHRLLCGDCKDAASVQRLWADEELRLVVTDPPYSSGGFQEAGRSAGTFGKIASDNLSSRGYQLLMHSIAGSGSTLIAAQQLGRACRAMEIEPAYCDVICRRWAEMTGKTPVREADGTEFVL